MSGIFFLHSLYRLFGPSSFPYPFNGLGFMSTWYTNPYTGEIRASIKDSDLNLGMVSFAISLIICFLLLSEVNSETLKEQALSEISSNPT
jgi:hypothetical protein